MVEDQFFLPLVEVGELEGLPLPDGLGPCVSNKLPKTVRSRGDYDRSILSSSEDNRLL